MFVRFRPLTIPVLITIFFLSIYIFTAPNDLQGNGDTWLRYQTTSAIVDAGTIYVEDPRWTDGRMVHGVGNHLYSIYAPGQIFAMVPLYYVGRIIAHHVTNDYFWTPIWTTHILDDIFGALLAAVFFMIALQLGYSRRVAFLLTLIFGFASVAWPDAESMLEHTQVTFFLVLGILCLLFYVQHGLRRRWWLAGCAFAIGLAFLTRYDTGIVFPLIPLYLILARAALGRPPLYPIDPDGPPPLLLSRWQVVKRSLRDPAFLRPLVADWLVYGLALLPSIVAAGIWNYARFGSVTKTGIPPTFGEPFLHGLAGLTLSPGKGLIWYMPILFLLPFAIKRFYRQHTELMLLFGAIVVVYFLLESNVIYWHGDPAWGPRYIYPTVPFLVWPLGVLLERWPVLTAWAKRAIIAVILISFSIQFVGVITPQYRFWYKEIHAQLVARQGFNWGYHRGQFWYFYYWVPARNPILISFENLYEITALRLFHQEQYLLWRSPIPVYEHLDLSNPIHDYEIDNYNLWWLAARHPFIGTHKNLVIAAFWLMLAIVSFRLLRKELDEATDASAKVLVELHRRPA
jgi:hypothetical protein